MDTSEAAGVLCFEDGSLKRSLELLVFEVERAALGMLAETSVRRGCEPFSVERQSHRVAEIEFRVPVEPRFRVRRADCELAGVALLDVLRGSIGDPDNRGRFALRVLFDDKCRPILRPGIPTLL